MGVKDLWTVLTPHAERKPISELRGKIVAIDLAGWVCESLNVVDYFVHPRHHLKNLFFRTCYLIWEEVTPVFVLEGTAPKLKSQVMEKRNEIQFRGVRPKDKPPPSQQPVNSQTSNKGGEKGRSRFNMVLKQCENLLTSMGIQCVQGPGEAEAYCAFLNQKGLVDGVISQDSDCFAYGAVRVYRNFSVSSQGALAAQGGAVDIYDMRQICSKMDFGQNKVIVMALLCGCDYCPDGIGGIGRDSVVKLFNKYKNDEILNKIRCWRYEDSKYSALEMKVDDKSICANCGHMGRTQSHSKSGCGICRTNRGCNESLWKEERLSIKAELILRKKALSDPSFPSEAIIEEFLRQPKEIPKLDLRWRQPNMVKFIKQVGHLLQWKEVYCFQKFFPILTRWQVMNATRLKEMPTAVVYVAPKEIVKKRVVKGIPSLEIIWQDEKGIFNGLVPESQLQEVESENPKGISDLWTTVEPTSLMETAFPEVVDAFLKSKEKPKKAAKKPRNKAKHLDSLDNLDDLMKATDEVAKTIKPKRQAKAKSATKLGLQPIDKYFKQANDKNQTPLKKEKLLMQNNQSSTPLTKDVPSDLESDEDIDQNAFNLSDIVNGIVAKGHDPFALTHHEGRQLQYETMPQDISLLLNDFDNSSFQLNSSRVQTKLSIDDLDVLCEKRVLSTSFQNSTNAEAKRRSLDDSFDILVKIGSNRVEKIKDLKISTESLLDLPTKPLNVVDRFKQKQRISLNFNTNNSSIIENDIGDSNGVSYFFNSSFQTDNEDVFEKLMETSLAKCDVGDQDSLDEGEFVLLSD